MHINETVEELEALIQDLKEKKRKEDKRHANRIYNLGKERDKAVAKIRLLTNKYELWYTL